MNKTPIVGERTAHLLNALRLNEKLLEEVHSAYSPAGEEEADGRVCALVEETAEIRRKINAWILDEINEWAISKPCPDAI